MVPQANGIQITQEAGTLRVAWDNRSVPKDKGPFIFLVLCWVVWTPITLTATGVLVVFVETGRPEAIFFAVWCVFGWAGVLGIPYTLLGRTYSEWIEVSPTAVSFGRHGWLAPRTRCYPIDDSLEFALGWYHDWAEPMSVVELYLVRTTTLGIRLGSMPGYWLAPTVKEAVFEAVRQFVRDNGIPLKVVTYGRRPDTGPSAENQGRTY